MTQPDDKFKIMLGAPILSGFAELMIAIEVILHQRVFVPVEIKLHTIKEHVYYLFRPGMLRNLLFIKFRPEAGFLRQAKVAVFDIGKFGDDVIPPGDAVEVCFKYFEVGNYRAKVCVHKG
jgi:hypothetical protein